MTFTLFKPLEQEILWSLSCHVTRRLVSKVNVVNCKNIRIFGSKMPSSCKSKIHCPLSLKVIIFKYENLQNYDRKSKNLSCHIIQKGLCWKNKEFPILNILNESMILPHIISRRFVPAISDTKTQLIISEIRKSFTVVNFKIERWLDQYLQP